MSKIQIKMNPAVREEAIKTARTAFDDENMTVPELLAVMAFAGVPFLADAEYPRQDYPIMAVSDGLDGMTQQASVPMEDDAKARTQAMAKDLGITVSELLSRAIIRGTIRTADRL